MKKNIIIGVLVVIILVLLIIIAIQIKPQEKYTNELTSDEKIIVVQGKPKEEYANELISHEKWSIAHVMQNLITGKEYIEAKQQSSVDNVSLKLKEGTLTKTGATFILIDKNKVSCGYGDEYKIDKKENGKWVPVTPISDYIWNLAMGMVSKEETELKKDWSKLYGELEKGQYRFGQSVNDTYVYAEFEIK